MSIYRVFCDASVSPKRKLGVGAYLILNNQEMEALTSDQMIESLVNEQLKYVTMAIDKPNVAEIKTFIHMLNELGQFKKLVHDIHCYTDCQTLCGLLGQRRTKLVASGFRNKKGEPLAHQLLYKQLFNLCDQYPLNIHKVKGHQPNRDKKTTIDNIFSYVDRLSRKKLRSM